MTDDTVLREMIHVQTANILALRGVVTVMAAGEELTEENVLQVIEPLLNPDAKIKVKNQFRSIVRGLATDIITTVEMRRSGSKPQK